MSLNKLVKIIRNIFTTNKNLSELSFDERFEIASRKVRKKSRGLSLASERIKMYYSSCGVLHDFYIFAHSETSFNVYAFYHSEEQREHNSEQVFEFDLKKRVIEELKKSGRDNCNLKNVNFVFESYESVKLNYKDYYNRFR